MITSTYARHAEAHPDKIAIHTAGEQITYRAWHELVCRTANWFSEKIEGRGKVGLFVPNGIPFLQLFAGAAMAGQIAVPFDVKWKANELQQRLDLAKPSLLITTKRLASRFHGMDTEVFFWEEIAEEIQRAVNSWNEEEDEERLFYIGFTSGTTGRPKAFVMSDRSWVQSFSSSQYDFQLNGMDEVLIPGALVHSHFLYGAICGLYFGSSVYILETFSPVTALQRINDYPISVLYVVPTMVEAMAANGTRMVKHLTIISSGAKWNEHSKEKIHSQFPNITMYEFYGSSETSFITYSNNESNRKKPASVGEACKHVELQIRDADGRVVETGCVGKVYVRSPFLFSGYIQPPHDELRSIEDEAGWITVDDIGYLDEEGFLYLNGRENSMIICGGENVYPEEIEAVLHAHPGVEEAAVIGVEDSYWGQVPVAFIRGDASKQQLQKHCLAHLSTFKCPRRWQFIDQFPYTTSGKIERYRLRQLLLGEAMEH